MYQVTSKGYKRILERCWETKIPLFVQGGIGIGKSQIPRQVFKAIADKKDKIFVEWEHTTDEQKMNVIKDADKYFVFCDQRIGQMDSTDLRGIPNMLNSEMLKTIPYSWVIYFTQAKAHGVVFFDEINLAPPTVSGTAYQIINDRTISDRRLGDDVLIIGAGNRDCDHANIFSTPYPLKDRFCEVEMGHNADEWCEWAMQSNAVNPLFVAFIKFSESSLYNTDIKKNDKPTTPRSIVRASNMVGDTSLESHEAFEMISIATGEQFAIKFQAFAKCHSQLNWDKIYKNPEMVKNFEIDKLFAVAGGMADQFVKGVKETRFDEMIEVILNMKPDLSVVSIKMMKDSNRQKFQKAIKACSNFTKIVKEYSKYIVD